MRRSVSVPLIRRMFVRSSGRYGAIRRLFSDSESAAAGRFIDQISLIYLTCLVFFIGSGCGPEHASRTASAPAYVGREVCSGCHAEAALAWEGSDHDRAMEEARPETVLGDFNDAVFRHCGVETRFFREGDGFFIHTQGTDGTMQTYPVAYTFGYEPLQQYLIPLENGRVQAFTVAWDTQGERWFSLAEDECITPPDWLHWTGDGMNWNYMCADCHSTNLQRNFNLADGAYETSFSEIDVSCEACHGPGETHVQEAQSGAYDPASSGLAATLSAPHQQVETCAPCHSRRRIVYPNHIAGNVFLDHYEPELLEEELYFADGQIRDEVYVYGSFLQSQMYAEGVVCADCHDPHTTQLKFEGNALCGQCHDVAIYDTFEHIRHPQESEGAQCVDCHMPERTYMVVDPRRDHSFKIPRPDLSARTGAPNVCQGCHTDQSAEWAAERIDDWHGPERPPSFATALAGGREGAPEAEPELIRLMEDHTAPDIVRATALTLLDRYATVRASEAAIQALGDEAPLVRAAAVRRLGAENSVENDRSAIPKLEPLLTDSVGLVRMEAARVLARIAPERYTRDNASETAAAWRNALQEYRDGQYALNDQAASHLNLAILHEHLGQSDSAAAAYRTAVRIDSTFVPAHLNLAMLLNRMREPGGADAGMLAAEAETSLRAAVRMQPDAAEVHYTLGLFLAETPDRLAEAATHLGRAAALDASNARIQYNAGLAYQQLGNAEQAGRLLSNALHLAPDHADYLNALSIFHAQQEAWDAALEYTDRLLAQYPDNPDLLQRRAWIAGQAQ